jgi:hypothetical protein
MLETECLWFSFSTLLQKELDKVLHHWNTHYIRRSRHDTLAGRPDELYYLPENVNAENHGHVVVMKSIKTCSIIVMIIKRTLFTRSTLQVYLPKVDLGNQTHGMKH